MNGAPPAHAAKSRLRIVFDTFMVLGAITSVSLKSFVPILIAGVLFCISAFQWRSEIQRTTLSNSRLACILAALILALVGAFLARA